MGFINNVNLRRDLKLISSCSCLLNKNLHLRQETNTPGVLRFKSFPKNIVFDLISLLVRFLLFDYSVETWCFQEKQKYHVTKVR